MAVSGTDLVEAAPLRSGAATSIALAISRESTLKWLTLGGIALIDAVWIAASDFHLVFAGAAGPIICALLFAAAAYFFRVVRRNPTLFILTDTLAQLIACFAVCGVLSYLVMSTNLPLADGELAAIDRALGFDWPRFIRWIQARPAVDYTLWLVYHSSIVQMFMIVFLPAARLSAWCFFNRARLVRVLVSCSMIWMFSMYCFMFARFSASSLFRSSRPVDFSDR